MNIAWERTSSPPIFSVSSFVINSVLRVFFLFLVIRFFTPSVADTYTVLHDDSVLHFARLQRSSIHNTILHALHSSLDYGMDNFFFRSPLLYICLHHFQPPNFNLLTLITFDIRTFSFRATDFYHIFRKLA